MTKHFSIAVAGVGRMGRWHLDKALAHPGFRVVGLFDADANRSAEVSAATKVPSFDDYDRLLETTDAVVIAAATAAHFSLAQAALEAGRHVLLEKPIARSVAEAEALAALARERGVRLQVGFVERFRLAQVRARLGAAPVRYFEADRLTVAFPRETGTDVVADLMTHDLDLLHWLSGADCASVSSIVDVEGNWGPVSASAAVRLTDGVHARLSASWVAHTPRRTLRVATETHWHEFDFLSNQVASRRRGGDWVTEPIASVDALALQMDDFFAGIQGKAAVGSTATDGVWTLQVADRVRAGLARAVSAEALRPAEALERLP
jgi:predicted dehydrogenase